MSRIASTVSSIISLTISLTISSLAGLALAGCSIPDTAFHPTPDGVGGGDQVIVLSTSTLSVLEGKTGMFDVALKQDPGTAVTVNLADSNATALPIDQPSIMFTGGPGGSWATPVTVTVSAPYDSNNTSETATITATGAGASVPATLTATVVDSTVVKQYGWPAPPPFTSSSLLAQGSVVAYKITVDANTNLDGFGVFVPAGSGFYRMALYRDSGANKPQDLVAQMAAPVALGNGVNQFDLVPDVPLDTTVGMTFWIAFRISQNTSVGYATTGTGTQCFRSQDIPNINDPWPATFGSPTCQSDFLMNFWINTYHQ